MDRNGQGAQQKDNLCSCIRYSEGLRTKIPCSRFAHKLGVYEWLAVQDYGSPFSVATPEGRV